MSKSDLQIQSWNGTWSYVGDLLYICFWFLKPNDSWYILSSQKRGLLNWNGFSVPFRVISFRSFSSNSGQKARIFLTAESTAFHVFVCISFLPCRLPSLRARTAFYSFLLVVVFVLYCSFEEGSCALVAWGILLPWPGIEPMTPAIHWTTWEVPHSNTFQYLYVPTSKESMNVEIKLQASLHWLCQFRKWIHVHAFAETRTY